MSKRNVTLKLTTQKDLVVVSSDARTFGELKRATPNVKWDGMRVVERATKNTLQVDDAVLPATDFVLFLVPEKVKSGIDVKNANYNDLRSHMSMLNKVKEAGLSLDGKVDDLRNRLIAYQKGTDNLTAEEGQDQIAVIEECRAKINTAIDTIIANAKVKIDSTEYVFKTSVEDLETEVSEIRKYLGL